MQTDTHTHTHTYIYIITFKKKKNWVMTTIDNIIAIWFHLHLLDFVKTLLEFKMVEGEDYEMTLKSSD